MAPASDALLVGKTRDHNLRNAELVWIDDVDGLGWVMDRLIDLVRISNRENLILTYGNLLKVHKPQRINLPKGDTLRGTQILALGWPQVNAN